MNEMLKNVIVGELQVWSRKHLRNSSGNGWLRQGGDQDVHGGKNNKEFKDQSHISIPLWILKSSRIMISVMLEIMTVSWKLKPLS